MANKEYIERLKQVIFHLHKADSKHVESVSVEERYRGRTIWKGIVEVFNLVRHPKAKRCYAWSHKAGKDDKDERFVAVLEIPPVKDPHSAVQVAIAAEVKESKK
ncbi:MAG: hypothetical protein ACREIC_07640 [Limisphaerales bacterium]